MDGFNQIKGCTSAVSPAYQCYDQFQPSQVPNASAYATIRALRPDL